MSTDKFASAQEWLMVRIGETPKTSLGWFRAGVGFYNKKEFTFSIECFQNSIKIDPLNYNAYQIMARACIAVNRREDAIAALKESVKLDNPSDWQLLVELTSQDQANRVKQATGTTGQLSS
jgi:tetratricopeptide (TPR) repeat protein